MHDLFARRDDVIEDYHGTKVADPYRWLENPASADTLAWVEAQNAITSQYISAIPARAKIQARMTALWDYPKYSVPVKRGDRYFFHKNTGLQDQSVLYMLRYHKFTVGRYWVSDYGNAETNPEHFKFMYAYSPLHNVKEGVAYPATFILAADTDDRVVPAHAKKFAATLQAANGGNNPILLRIEMKAGHGLGKPTAKVIEERSDILAFLFDRFSMSTQQAS